ncbi:hypothetical protein [Rhodoferax sp.]|uniref:hypothetical protein n=1 Tax=Rhodoferax sp. TaxID=50421 RepID=UPI0028438020|nr:hypothetical protein [Rhodoferax sp.]MDR3370628.1 hypothetical protein [Rhodoferax sp.]
MPTETSSMSTGPARDAGADERLVLLEEVDFKWLMAGQGWWIDTWRLHTDSGYASHLLQLVEQIPSTALRTCAAHLQTSLGLG